MLSEFLALTSAQSSPVGLTFRGTPRIGALLDEVEATQEPLLDFADANGVAQRVWEVTDPSFLQFLNEDLQGAEPVRDRRGITVLGPAWS